MNLGKIAESDWFRQNNFSNVNSGKPYAFRLRYKIAIYMDVLRNVYTELSLRLASTRMLKSGKHFPLIGKSLYRDIREFTICDEAARRRSFKTSKFVRIVSGLWSQRNSQRRCRSQHDINPRIIASLEQRGSQL